ncbi:MAG: hypothetical protein H7831_08955, partial [Magnetococcus sp. WYHC-3]
GADQVVSLSGGCTDGHQGGQHHPLQESTHACSPVVVMTMTIPRKWPYHDDTQSPRTWSHLNPHE